MSSKELNVAIVGTGIFASQAHLPNIEKVEGLKPYSAFNRTKSKAEKFAELAKIDKSKVADSLEEIFQDENVDIVDALLPVQTNVEIVKMAIKHNKPLMFEKPIAANLKQAKEIVELSNSTKLPISILEQWSYFSVIDTLKNDILPKIGDVIAFTHNATGAFNEANKYASTAWRMNPEHIGGYLSDGGVHQLALLTGVLGEVDTISAQTKQVRKESGTVDTLFSTLKLQNGIIGNFTYTSALGATDKSTSLTIYGTNGSVVYDWSPSLPKPTITYQTGSSSQTASDKTVIEVNEVNAIQEEFKNFELAVSKNDKNLVGVKPATAFHHLAIIGAALDSAANNGDSIKVERV
ncbi:NAD(P)-binding protein [Hyphopichia burtonii NRRL Y-1933]|uniref:NAD(P)-binding protein n=1 Tax=Hyphopichia burtonii NRRL Y-1933 TaxID=984485 RepID=A0A1E4RD94_9ASCO|nr:NAD(P)-binding protein [Hyphopichia burtonii NRRL Y-1933]ODV65221.1 NAD(P)-binding protein [Hyphopichia burtonii NRRL Y-1933]